MPSSQLSAVHRLAQLLLSIARPAIVKNALLTVALTFTEGVGLLLLLPLIQLVGVGSGQANGLVGVVGRAFAWIGITPTLGAVLVVYVAVGGMQAVLQRWQTISVFDLQQQTVVALRARVYRALARTEWVVFARLRVSELTRVLTVEIDRCGLAAYYLADLAASFAIAVVYLGLAFRLSPGITSLVLACGIGLAWLIRRPLASARVSGERISASSAALHSAIAEHLGGMKTAKSYGATGRHVDAVVQLSDRVKATLRANVVAYSGLKQTLALGSLVALASVVYISRAAFDIRAAPLLVLLFLFGRLMPRLTSLYEKGQSLFVVLPSLDVALALEQRCQRALEPAGNDAMEIGLTQSVALERVTFAYGDDETPAIRGVDLTIERGRTTAIVGPSGSGKSTLADVVLGLLTPLSGRVLVDGRALSPDQAHAWRRHIGYVAQDPFIFHDTVRNNLLWAQPAATEEDLWAALRAASADVFVASLPDGLDTILGDRGALVSGGERQRIALARALVRQPQLLILDEATSALDGENEIRIQQAIDELRHTNTILIITHRLSAIRHADVIFVLDQGRVVESGTWEALIAQSGRFRDLLHAQESYADVG